jgi:hypothetical protein
VVDGRPLAAYVHARVAGGRVFAPVAPLLTRIADRIWIEGTTLVLERGERRVRVQIVPPFSGELSDAYVPAGPALRELGAWVRYEPSARRLMVTLPARATLASPTPFDTRARQATPRDVFTPVPAVTPRPVWSGSPLPRRTALPLPPPSAPERAR